MKGIRLISGCSRVRPLRKFMMLPRARVAVAAVSPDAVSIADSSLACSVHDIDKLYRLHFHIDDEAVNQGPEVSIENQRRHRDRQSEAGVVQSDRNTVRE